MSTGATSTTPGGSAMPSRERVARLASLAFCGVLPALVLVLVFAASISDGSYGIDFRQFYRAAEAILAGQDPYPNDDALLTASGRPYVYPPLPGILIAPMTLLSLEVASVIAMSTLVVVALAVLWVLGVRDWRCYGVFLLWPPVISAIQTGNPTLWLALAAALVWRFRDDLRISAPSLGVTLAIKFLLWPLGLWLLVTRRFAAAIGAALIGGVLLLGAWAVIGFTGLVEYPDLLRRLEETIGDDAYTLFNLLEELGAPNAVALAGWLGLGVGLLLACVHLARRGDERSAFVLALSAALALTPLVWLHYFAFLVVAVAIVRPRLGLVWFIPLAMFVATGSGDPSPAQTAVTLLAAAATIALALHESRRALVA